MEDQFPGLWQTWFLEQTAAIGWPPNRFSLHDSTRDTAWKLARQAAQKVTIGDKIIVQLKDNHVGRIGTVIAVRIKDDEWLATVPATKELKRGEMGRRFEVKWDLTVGSRPISPSAIAKLPEGIRFTGATLRRTISPVKSQLANSIEQALKDITVWTTLQNHFATERSISEYIAAYPHRLEDGMTVYPNAKVREYVFSSRRRADVLLQDSEKRLVVVECKQGTATEENIDQLLHYMEKASEKLASKKEIRGILVHGGASKPSERVKKKLEKHSAIDLIRFSVDVEFIPSR
ncbi:MAG TPA: endonuclease NucS domain-containing protein [Acidobacteriaceae bacterium]